MVKPQKPDPQRPQKPQKQQKPGWKIKITTKKTLNIYPPFPCLPLLACWLAGFLACLLAGWLAGWLACPLACLPASALGTDFWKKIPGKSEKIPGKFRSPLGMVLGYDPSHATPPGTYTQCCWWNVVQLLNILIYSVPSLPSFSIVMKTSNLGVQAICNQHLSHHF